MPRVGWGVPQIYQEWDLGQGRAMSQEEAWDGGGGGGEWTKGIYFTLSSKQIKV